MTLEVVGLAVAVLSFSYWLTGRFCASNTWLILLDRPNERSLHTRPTPRTGGLAILASLAVGLLMGGLAEQMLGWPHVSIWAEGPANGNREVLWILGMVVLIAATSFADDKVGIHQGVRFCVHGIASVGVVWGAKMSIDTVDIPTLGSLSFGWSAVSVTMLFLMWMANLYNFMDGIDGFAGGMTVLGYGFLGFTAWEGGHRSMAMLCLLVSTAAGGFLIRNFPPARIFMGDVGSVSIGFLAGALSVMGVHDGLFDVWVPFLIFSPFIVDATVTLLKRTLRGEKVWEAHRDHYYQRLVLAGWGHRKTVCAGYLLMLACGASALLYLQLGDRAQVFLLTGWVTIYSILIQGVRFIEARATRQLDVKL